MGRGTWDGASRATYSAFASSTAGKSTEEIYRSRGLHPDLDPKKAGVRESRDSAENPESTPIIVALDVTGSMGMLADVIARTGLGTLFEQILAQKPVTDPHLMFMGVGDVLYDSAPLQVSQFEADSSIIQQLTNIYLEHGGGGNHFESYHFPWYFGAFHTVHDAMEKRGRRGYLFTVGDEEAPETPLTSAQIKGICGADVQKDLDPQELYQLASRVYDCYHIVIEEGNYARHRLASVKASWADMIGQKVICLSDHLRLAETIVETINLAEGNDAPRPWDPHTHRIVADATRHLPRPS